MGYDDNDTLAGVARHEAAHALACIAVGGTNVTAIVKDGTNPSGESDPPQHLDDDDIDRVVVYAAGLLAQARLGMLGEIDGTLRDIGRVWSTLEAKGRQLTGGSDPDIKDLLFWALGVGGVTSQFLAAVWTDVIQVARRLADNPGTALLVDDYVDVDEVRAAFAQSRAGIAE